MIIMKRYGRSSIMKSSGYKKYLTKIKRDKILVILSQVFILVFLVVLWQWASDKGYINTFISSSPRNVVRTIVDLYNSNNLFNHIWVTVYETIISFLLGTFLGIIIAVIMWYNKFISRVIDPYLTILNSLPKVSLGPILIIWVGANISSIIVMALLISLIITIINVYNGFNSTDLNKIKLLKSFGASKVQMLKYLILPSNYSVIISSLKINVSMSLIGPL